MTSSLCFFCRSTWLDERKKHAAVSREGRLSLESVLALSLLYPHHALGPYLPSRGCFCCCCCCCCCVLISGNRRGEDNAVNAEFQYKYDNEEVRFCSTRRRHHLRNSCFLILGQAEVLVLLLLLCSCSYVSQGCALPLCQC